MENLFAQFDLSNFKVHKPVTLFQPTAKEIKDSLSKKQCIHCHRKLKIDRRGNGRCGSKFKCKLFVKAETLKKYEVVL